MGVKIQEIVQKRLGEEGKGRDNEKGMRTNILILAPHPDDESIIGLLPLRLQDECGFKVWVIPATMGSRVERQSRRKKELRAACQELGFRLHFLRSGQSATELCHWLKHMTPSVVFMPHAKDGHPTHRATHRLGVAAMDESRPLGFHVVETEYWHPLLKPNLMVSAGKGNLAKLRRALACHKGEVARNNFAMRLPAWMSDNVRRGAELVGDASAKAPDIAYATLYRARTRTGGKWRPPFLGGKTIVSSADLADLAARWA